MGAGPSQNERQSSKKEKKRRNRFHTTGRAWINASIRYLCVLTGEAFQAFCRRLEVFCALVSARQKKQERLMEIKLRCVVVWFAWRPGVLSAAWCILLVRQCLWCFITGAFQIQQRHNSLKLTPIPAHTCVFLCHVCLWQWGALCPSLQHLLTLLTGRPSYMRGTLSPFGVLLKLTLRVTWVHAKCFWHCIFWFCCVFLQASQTHKYISY